jgi:hypothetical protein
VPPPHIAGTGRGMLPEVPAEYSQVPMVPARMGKNDRLFLWRDTSNDFSKQVNLFFWAGNVERRNSKQVNLIFLAGNVERLFKTIKYLFWRETSNGETRNK